MPGGVNLLYWRLTMADKEISNRTPDMRKGIVIFIALLAVIAGLGVYLHLQARALDSQYDRVERVL